MSRTHALRLLAGSLILLALGHGAALLPAVGGGAADLLPPRAGAWLLLLGTMGALCAVALLGASRHGRAPRALLLPLALAFLLVTGGVGGALLLPPPTAGTPLWLGLPPGAALMIYGAGLLPLLVVPLAYAWSFSELGMEPHEVDELLARARRARDASPPAADSTPRRSADPPDTGAGP